MNLNKKSLLDVLQKIQGLVSTNTNLSITRSVLIRSENGEIELLASNLDTGYVGKIKGDAKDLKVAINGLKLFEIVKGLPGEMVKITENDNRWIQIGCDDENIQYRIAGDDPDDFPEAETIETNYTIDSETFLRLLSANAVIHPDPKETRTHLISSLIEAKNDVLAVVSTDGSRLIWAGISYAGDFRAVVPKRGLIEIMKILDGMEASFGIDGNRFAVKVGDETIITRMVDGEYPDFQQVLDFTGEVRFEGESKELVSMFKRMSILSSSEYKSAIFRLENNRLKVRMVNPDFGESEESISVKYEGESFETCYNLKLWIDAISAIGEPEITAVTKSPESPCVITGGDRSIVAVVMPMRV